MNINLNAALVSELAYKGIEAFANAGYTEITEYRDDETGTDAFIVEDKDCIYVVFAGTNESVDIRTDVRFLKKKAFSKFSLHRGFWEAWNSVSVRVATDVMQRALDRQHSGLPKKVGVYCGHSLGGALATIAAATHAPDFCITFGAPAVGGRKFAKHIAELSTTTIRYVYDADPVPHLLRWNPWYRQAGELRFIDNEGTIYRNPSLWFMLKKRFPWVYQVTDHDLSNYVISLFGWRE